MTSTQRSPADAAQPSPRPGGRNQQEQTRHAYWFLGVLAVVHTPGSSTPMVIELTVPAGGSPPLHVHHDLDDNFYLLDGRLAVRRGDETSVVEAGTFVEVPRGVSHTFRVLGHRPARMLSIHNDDSFLRFAQILGEPARSLTLPLDMPAVDIETITRAAAQTGTAIIGLSMSASEAERIDPLRAAAQPRRYLTGPPGTDAGRVAGMTG